MIQGPNGINFKNKRIAQDGLCSQVSVHLWSHQLGPEFESVSTSREVHELKNFGNIRSNIFAYFVTKRAITIKEQLAQSHHVSN